MSKLIRYRESMLFLIYYSPLEKLLRGIKKISFAKNLTSPKRIQKFATKKSSKNSRKSFKKKNHHKSFLSFLVSLSEGFFFFAKQVTLKKKGRPSRFFHRICFHPRLMSFGDITSKNKVF